MRTQGHGALAPQPVGPSGQLGKEQTLPGAEDLFSLYGVRLGQSDSAPHAGTRSVGVELIEYIQEQDGGTTETVSEAPGAYGGCGGGHAAGAAPYETASTLVPWPSSEVGVGRAAQLRVQVTPSLPPKPSPRGQTFHSFGQECPWNKSPGTLWFTQNGLRQGLGGHVQRACSVGGLDGSPTALAHQLPRVAGSTPGLEPSQETLTRRACTSPYGQHCDRCVQSTDKVVYAPVACHTTRPPPSSSGVGSIWGRFAPFISRVCSTGQPTSCHELRSPENGDSIPRRSSWFGDVLDSHR